MKRFVTLLALLTAASPALAQDEDDSRRVQYKQRTEIDFDAVDVAGELVKPSNNLTSERRKASFNPLIQLRADFNDEMKWSVNEVQ